MAANGSQIHARTNPRRTQESMSRQFFNAGWL